MVQRRWLWFIVVFMLPALACNAFAGAVEEPALPLPPTTVTDTTPTNGTPEPTATVPGLAPTATLPSNGNNGGEDNSGDETGPPTVTVLVDLNVRNGPSVQYERVGFLPEGGSASIIGVDPASGWWKIDCPANINSSECWLSGGVQYSSASNATSVPVAAVPPTPTPVPVVLDDNTGLLAYVDNGRLTSTQLDLTQNPPVARDTIQLDDSPDVQELSISPDGTAVAYLVQVVDGNELRVVNIDGHNRRTLVRSTEMPFVGSATELPDFANEGDSNLSVQILQMNWVNDDTIAFNTGIINRAGFSPGSHSDLWTVTTAGNLVERVQAGQGGPIFTISAGNQVLFSRQDAILRAGVDGSNLETVLTFEPVGISEAFYYPRPHWVADGSLAYVAVSDQLFADGTPVEKPTATIWLIRTSGLAEKAGTLATNAVFEPPAWSADGQQLVFVARDDTADAANLVVANGLGLEDKAYLTDAQPRPLDWSSSSEHFLFGANGFYGVGQIDGKTAVQFPLSGDQQAVSADWILQDLFITAVSGNGIVEYQAGNRSGDVTVVAQAAGFVPLYDTWAPQINRLNVDSE